MNIPHPDTWDESSLHLLPVFTAEIRLQTERLTAGPADDVPLYDAAQRVTWLTAAIARLRRIEERKKERLAAQANLRATEILTVALELLRQKRSLSLCDDSNL